MLSKRLNNVALAVTLVPSLSFCITFQYPTKYIKIKIGELGETFLYNYYHYSSSLEYF